MPKSGREEGSSCKIFSYSYFVFLLVIIFLVLFWSHRRPCYLELFVSSVSVSAAQWNVSIATSPITGCSFSISALNSRLLLGDKVIAESIAIDNFRKVLDGERPATELRFTTKTEVDGGDTVVWDARVEFLTRVRLRYNGGFLAVTCDHLPVRFLKDPAGNMKGSLLGNTRRCDYIFRRELDELH